MSRLLQPSNTLWEKLFLYEFERQTKGFKWFLYTWNISYFKRYSNVSPFSIVGAIIRLFFLRHSLRDSHLNSPYNISCDVTFRKPVIIFLLFNWTISMRSDFALLQLSQTNPPYSNKHWNRVRAWLLFNANSAISQQYHGENKLIFNQIMRRPVLY